MSALDDAIAAHLVHPAGASGDPLADSLYEQQCCTQPAPLDPAPPLREGWENEPIVVPHCWRLYAAAVAFGALLSSFLGTGAGR